MITEDFCSFELAQLLKEKGFNEPCNGRYSYRGGNVVVENYPISNESLKYHPNIDGISASTHQMAMKWLREEKNISIVIDDDEIPLSYKYIIKKYSINDKSGVLILKLDSLPFIKYEIAVEAAIKYSLENLI